MTTAQFWHCYVGLRPRIRASIQYYARLYGIIPDELESIFLLTVQGSLHTYDPEIGPLMPWLKQVLRSTMAQMGRTAVEERRWLGRPPSEPEPDLDLDDIGFWGVTEDEYKCEEEVAEEQARQIRLSFLEYVWQYQGGYKNGRQTRVSILNAMSELAGRGAPLTTRNIATECGLSHVTVARHLSKIRRELGPDYQEMTEVIRSLLNM